MSRNPGLSELQKILAELYPSEDESRQVVDKAGVPAGRIKFSSAADSNWFSILAEAQRRGLVPAIVEEAAKDYSSREAELLEAQQEYLDALEADDDVPEPNGTDVPEWFPRAGVAFGGLTLLFFMVLVIVSMFAVEVPASSRFFVVVVLALGSALSTSFLGGWAIAEGRVSIPLLKAHPLQFSASGGIAVLIILVILGYWAYVRPAPGPAEASLPSVLVIDSKEPDQVYNPEEGGTNTDQIRDILRWLPIEPPMEELVHYEWDDYEIISRSAPDLIIIHASAFYTTTILGDPAKKLDTFLGAMQDTPSKFLIYSRRADFEHEEEMLQYYVNRHASLEGRADVLWVPKTEYCTYWKCSETREELRRKVKSLLGLP